MRHAALLVCALAVASPLIAQEIETPDRPIDADQVIAIYPGVAPGSENWAWQEQVSNPPWGGRGGRLVRNVVRPTLTLFRPPEQRPVHQNGCDRCARRWFPVVIN